eukprot:264856-Pyramimonas_sp.AAC.1
MLLRSEPIGGGKRACSCGLNRELYKRHGTWERECCRCRATRMLSPKGQDRHRTAASLRLSSAREKPTAHVQTSRVFERYVQH